MKFLDVPQIRPLTVVFNWQTGKSKELLVKTINISKKLLGMKLSLRLCILILEMLIISCSKHVTALPGDSSQKFPATIGTNWKYIVFDSLHNSIDTQIVAILGVTNLKDGRAAKIVKSYFTFKLDTTYSHLVQEANKAIFYTSKDGTDYNKVYVFPLKISSSWIGENVLDTNKVTSNKDIAVSAGHFNSYLILKKFQVTNQAVRENEWFCPGVGMIQRDYYERNIGFMLNKHYELISYYLAK